MAISSVARKATVKKDDTLLKTIQLVNRQKLVSGKLQNDADRLKFEQGKEARKETADNLKRLDAIDAPAADIHRKEHDRQMGELNDIISDPSITRENKDVAISQASQYAKSSNSFSEGWKAYMNTVAGDQEKRKLRNEDGLAQIGAEYLTNADGTAKPLDQIDMVELEEIADNDLRSYNLEGSTQEYLNTVQDTIATQTSAENMNGLAVKVETTTQSADFAVLDGAGNIEMNEQGEPTIVISNASLAAFKKNKGHVIAMTELAAESAKNTGTGMSQKDAMEKVLRDQGHLTVRSQKEVKTLAAKTPSETDKRRVFQNADEEGRVRFLEESLATGGEGIVSILKLGRGVVDSADVLEEDGLTTTSHTTGVEKIEGGKRFTIVVDKDKFKNVPEFFTMPGTGEQIQIPMETDKTGKFIVSTIDVLDSDPKTGLLQLSGLYNPTVRAIDRIDHAKFAEAYDRLHANDNPFGEAGFGGEDGGFGFEPEN